MHFFLIFVIAKTAVAVVVTVAFLQMRQHQHSNVATFSRSHNCTMFNSEVVFLPQNYPASNLHKFICDVIHLKFNYLFFKIHTSENHILIQKKKEGKGIQAFGFGEKNVELRKPRLKICVHQQSDMETHRFISELQFLSFFLNKSMNTCFLYLRNAEDQKILKRYAKFCNLKSLSQVSTCQCLIEGSHIQFIILFFLNKIGNVGFLSCRLSILSRVRIGSWGIRPNLRKALCCHLSASRLYLYVYK